ASLARAVADSCVEPGFRRIGVDVSDEVLVEVDGFKIRQILVNLMRNALEAAPDTLVSVCVRSDVAGARVTIRDNVPGLSDELRSRLFEPFVTTKPSGTGLCLAISAALARSHGALPLARHAPCVASFELS